MFFGHILRQSRVSGGFSAAMCSYYFTVSRGSKTLHIASLTDRKIEASGQEIADPSGYFLFETTPNDGVEIVAQILSEGAALRLCNILGMA